MCVTGKKIKTTFCFSVQEKIFEVDDRIKCNFTTTQVMFDTFFKYYNK